ncbi:hypothetical protein CK203_049009 [Vitis vinifera]|uniref:Uncharacterized protein n=1 Tax=Vitis vinifera TaxID=29760 RepID=A0A438HDB7_VITVI|nr:hypothetical protein CK203_049009 [Vitis vinifera]
MGDARTVVMHKKNLFSSTRLGRFLAELTKQVLLDLEASKYQVDNGPKHLDSTTMMYAKEVTLTYL